MKVCIILTGAPGSGKSTFADFLIGDTGEKHEADNFCYNEKGEYEFKPERASHTHDLCFKDFQGGINSGKSPLVVSNTNTEEWQWKRYKDAAESAGYQVFITTMQNHHEGTSVHDVPEETVKRMKKHIMNSMKL